MSTGRREVWIGGRRAPEAIHLEKHDPRSLAARPFSAIAPPADDSRIYKLQLMNRAASAERAAWWHLRKKRRERISPDLNGNGRMTRQFATSDQGVGIVETMLLDHEVSIVETDRARRNAG